MTRDIDWDPEAARAIDDELTRSYEAAKAMATSLETYAQNLMTSWYDESAADVVELLRSYKVMYEKVAEKIPQVQWRLRETGKLMSQIAAENAVKQRAAEAAKAQAETAKAQAEAQKWAQQQQAMRDRYPDYNDLPKIGPDRRRY
jgi:uncharacterized membrane-anchored protein YhcB (DUF1043 family)